MLGLLYFQEQKKRWVFGRHKLKRLTSQSAVAERPKSAEKKVKPEDLLVGQETGESKQVSDGVEEREIFAAIKIQTAFRGLLVCFLTLNSCFFVKIGR